MQALEELVNLIMLEDFVARRTALNKWSQRWLQTAHVDHKMPLADWLHAKQALGEAKLHAMENAALAQKVLENLQPTIVHRVEDTTDSTRHVHIFLHFIRSEPHADR